MIRITSIAGVTSIACATLVAGDFTWADEDIDWVTTSRGRYEIAIGAHSWPGIAELQPAREGSFDEVGLNLSMSGHWPVWRFDASELLLGIDLGLFSNESNVRFVTEDVFARGGYLVPSLKWMFGRKHRYSIDAGATVDIGGGDPGRNRGVMLSFKTHFVDFGSVGDQSSLLPQTLGNNAGDLTGPVYMMQVGYRWR